MAAISARFRFRRESLILRRWAAAREVAALGMQCFRVAESALALFGWKIPASFEMRGVSPLCAEAFGVGGEARLCRFSFARRFFLGGGGGIFFLPAICARGIREKVSAVWRAAMRLLSLRGAWIRPAGTRVARHTAALKRPLRGVFAHFYYMPGLEG